MASSSSSPQERSIASPKVYDAFISHRGPDVKDTLAKPLYDLLKARECKAFLDREEIEGGESISAAIRNGICSSVVQIAIFSNGYAESKWCLNELVDMLKQTDALFIPVFYGVDPKELRCTERGAYAAAFSYYQSKEKYLNKVDEWKMALESAADKSGYELHRYQDNLCEKIVSRVLQETDKRRPLHVADHPVGLAELVQDFESSCSETVQDKAKIVGIYGLGGSGKTTLARELLNRKRSGYHASCFLSDVRESDTKGELHCLQSQLLKDLLREDRKISNIDEGIGQLKHRLGSARHFHFLIVLDDVDSLQQLRPLLFEDMLSPGSLVIVTTRNQSVLRGADITIRYKMKEMDRDHAKQLFCSHAFRERDIPFEYENLVESFVDFCAGLPLSLTVLGAHVYRRDKYYWELELEKVQKIQPGDIMERLKISFDGLDREEQQIFIDIACFFNKFYHHDMKSKAISIWKASGWSAEHALQTLQDKSLLEVEEKWDSYCHGFKMHDHLRDLGRQMADKLGPPRLWRPDVLRSMEAKGFQKILAETKGRCFHSFVDSSLEAKITYFIGSLNDSAETELLLLVIDNRFHNLENFPSCLSVDWMEELWSTFQQQLQTDTQVFRYSLLEIKSPFTAEYQRTDSFFEINCECQASFELRILKICHSGSSQNLLDFIGLFSRLEVLDIVNFLKETDITSFLQSLKQLSNLRSLRLWVEDFSGNLNLDASTSSRMNSLETINLSSLNNMSKLLISGEICPGLRSLEVQEMENLNEMHLMQLKRLNILKVEFCSKLETISGLSSLTGLQSLIVYMCPRLETMSGLSSLTGLQSLQVLSSLTGLQSLQVCYCEKLKTISGLSSLTGLQSLQVCGCDKLETISRLFSLTGLQSLRVGNCDKLEASTSSRMNNLETIKLSSLNNMSKLLISREICPGLRSLNVGNMGNLNEMHLKQLKRLNILRVEECDKLEIISGLSSLRGLQSLRVVNCDKLERISGLSSLTGLQSLRVVNCDKLKRISGLSSLTGLQEFGALWCARLISLPTFAHLRHLERIMIVECHQLQSIEGFEELQGLKSLHIKVAYNRYAVVRNCVHGLKRLPSEYTVLRRNAVDETLCRLDKNLFSDVIGDQSVTEIERGEYSGWNELKMGRSSRAITIYALLVTPGEYGDMRLEGGYHQRLRDAEMITVLLPPNNKGHLAEVSIEQGFVATVNEGEEGKALTLLQTIVDRLYGESLVPSWRHMTWEQIKIWYQSWRHMTW